MIVFIRHIIILWWNLRNDSISSFQNNKLVLWIFIQQQIFKWHDKKTNWIFDCTRFSVRKIHLPILLFKKLIFVDIIRIQVFQLERPSTMNWGILKLRTSAKNSNLCYMSECYPTVWIYLQHLQFIRNLFPISRKIMSSGMIFINWNNSPAELNNLVEHRVEKTYPQKSEKIQWQPACTNCYEIN